MAFFVLRFLYGLWLVLGALILITTVARFLFGDVPEGLAKNKLRFLVEGLVLSFVWPLGTLTPTGRKLIWKYLPSLRSNRS